MPPILEKKRSIIGYWMTDKKVQKLNMLDFKKECKNHGYDLVKLDLTRSLEEQGPFCVIFHKCTEIIVKANVGDVKSQQMLLTLENYLAAHPEVPIVDPLDKIRRVLDRYNCYLAIRSHSRLTAAGVFAPTSVELTSNVPATNLAILKAAGVSFPFVCKPSVSHGGEAHGMALIFNEAGIADCRPPAVAQTFINHNAVLYKLYCIGNQYAVIERPSLKNFYSIKNEKTIFFSSSDVSKPDSTSSLNALDAGDPMRGKAVAPLDPDRIQTIVESVRDVIGLQLLGLDIVVENSSGRYAIIDINSYPGYDGFPNLFGSMISCLEHSIKQHMTLSDTRRTPDAISPIRTDQEDSGIDTSDSSDERKKQLCAAKIR